MDLLSYLNVVKACDTLNMPEEVKTAKRIVRLILDANEKQIKGFEATQTIAGYANVVEVEEDTVAQ